MKRADIALDERRCRAYLTTLDGNLDAYDLRTQSFLPPLRFGHPLKGLDISPSLRLLAVTDESPGLAPDHTSLHIVDLSTGRSQRVCFPAEFLVSGTLTAVFLSDNELLVGASIAGTAQVPIRRVSLDTGAFRTVMQLDSTVFAPSGNRRLIAFAETNNSGGVFGSYVIADGAIRTTNANSYLDSVGVNRDASQYAVPAYPDVQVYDATLAQIGTIPSADPSKFPLGVTYSPIADELFVSFFDGSLGAYDTSSLNLLRQVATGLAVSSISGVFPSRSGYLRASAGGQLLAVSVDGGFQVYPL